MKLNLTETPKSGSKHTLTYYMQSKQQLKGNKNKLKHTLTTMHTLILRSHNNNGNYNKQELIKTIINTKQR
jgi:hypothetical protein